MTTLEGFHAVTEVTADERSRIPVGRAGAHKDDRYAVSVNDDGVILLVPMASIPKRELFIWENDQLRASLFRGLADAAEGKIERRDWLTDDSGCDDE